MMSDAPSIRSSFALFTLALVGGGHLHALDLSHLDRHLDRWGDALFWESENTDWYFEPLLQADLWYYHRDDPANFIGFWFPKPGEHSRVSYRASLRTTLTYKDWLLFGGKFRVDDGVHPGVSHYYNRSTEYRVDEFYLRLSPDPRFNLQIGRFTPIFGSYLERQDTWNASLISYPMMYENVTTISDISIPASADHQVRRRGAIKNPLTWLPAIWGPLYPTGGSAFGAAGDWTYAVSLLNSSVSSRGLWWEVVEFSHPTIASRVTYKPHAAWRFGTSLSSGTYLRYPAEELTALPNDGLPPGKSFDDYQQRLFALDLQYQRGHFQLWTEGAWVSYDVPNVADDVRYFTYFIEGRYQVTPKVWLSARWSEELFNSIETSNGPETWNYDLQRVELGLGYRFSRHAQIKTQYTFQDSAGPLEFGQRMFLVEFTFRL